MNSFKDQTNVSENLKFYDLLPKKVRHTINRYRNKDKYKGALLMMKHLRKNPDVIKRGLTKNRIQGIAADHFGLNHKEFDKILNRQTRYEMDEAYTIAYKGPKDIKSTPYSDDQLDDIDKLYTATKDKTTNPLIFDTDSDIKNKIKVHPDVYTKGLEKDYPYLVGPSGRSSLLVSGSGSVGKGSDQAKLAIDLAAFGIATKTDFLEFFQCIGLFISTALDASNLKSELGKLKIRGDFKIRTYISEWEKFVAYIDADKSLGKDVITLVNGSFYYRTKDIKFSLPTVIWTGIDKYYTALKTKEGIEGNIKKNTSDCVLINGTSADLYKVLSGKAPIKTDDKTGLLSCDGLEWYQISLKKGDGVAKLGKITTFMKGKYEPDVSNMDLGKVTDEFPELIGEHYLQEGFFGDTLSKLKDISVDIAKNFAAAAKKVLQFGKDVFNKIKALGKKYENSTEKEIERLTKRSKFLKENYLGEMTQKAMLTALVDDPRINKSYTSKIEKYRSSVDSKSNDTVQIINTKHNKISLDENTVNFLVTNVISFQLMDDIIKDVKKNGINVINDLNQSMAMGDTNLPVVKVYGNPTQADTEVITVGKISQAAPKREGKPISVLKVLIKPHNSKPYYVTNMWLFAELVDGVAKYHKIAFKKSGASTFNFNIEGTSTIPEDKISEFPL